MTLEQLLPGQNAVITHVHGAAAVCRRLAHLGFLEGTPIACVGYSPHGNPRAYLLRGCVMALRMEDIEQIEIEEEKNNACF